MAKKKKRLSFDASPAPLNDAFSGLAVGGLAAGPSEPKEESRPAPGPTWPKRLCLRREKAHRGGKTVMIVSDFPQGHQGVCIDELAKKLKQHCGCGGTVKNCEIILQGDKAQVIAEFLEGLGIQVRGVTE